MFVFDYDDFWIGFHLISVYHSHTYRKLLILVIIADEIKCTFKTIWMCLNTKITINGAESALNSSTQFPTWYFIHKDDLNILKSSDAISIDISTIWTALHNNNSHTHTKSTRNALFPNSKHGGKKRDRDKETERIELVQEFFNIYDIRSYKMVAPFLIRCNTKFQCIIYFLWFYLKYEHFVDCTLNEPSEMTFFLSPI